MGSIQDEWKADALDILAEIPKAVTVRHANGTPTAFNVLLGAPMIQQDMETGGFLDSASYEVKFHVDDIAAHPGVVVKGNLVNYVDKDFRIVAINPRTNSAWVICRVQAKAGPA